MTESIGPDAEPPVDGAAPDGEAPEAPPDPQPSFELPTARQVVSRGLQLALEASRDIRSASIYIGALLLVVVAPAVLLWAVELRHLGDLVEAGPLLYDPTAAATALSIVAPLWAVAILATMAAIAVMIDGGLIAVGLLAARAVGRPYRLRDAIARSRQVFWRYAVATGIVGLLSNVVSTIVGLATGAFAPNASIGSSLLATLVAAIIALPFGYIATAIVVGDVGGLTAIRRSLVLVQARPPLAVAVAAFAFLASAIQVFGIGAAADAVGEVAQIVHPDVDLIATPWLLAPLVALAIVAFGSLSVTVTAVASGPQVAAFLGLTHYAAGLDRAAVPAVARPSRLVTRPMLVVVVLELFVVGGGLLAAPAAGDVAAAPEPLITGALHAAAPGQALAFHGGFPNHRVHPRRGTTAGTDAAGDGAFPSLVAAEVVAIDTVPTTLLETVFRCGAANVACSSDGSRDSAFDAGALLFAQQVAALPGVEPGLESEAGPVLDLAGYPTAPPGDRLALASHAVLTVTLGGTATVKYWAWQAGRFQEYLTNARSRWVGTTLLTLVPIRDEIQAQPIGWDAYAHAWNGPGTADRQDELRDVPGGPLLPYLSPPALDVLAGPVQSP